jgi:hypothetical protein
MFGHFRLTSSLDMNSDTSSVPTVSQPNTDGVGEDEM